MMKANTKKISEKEVKEACFFEAASKALETLRENPDVPAAGIICFDEADELGPTYFWVQKILYSSQKWEDFLEKEGVSCSVCSIPSYESKPLVWLTLD